MMRNATLAAAVTATTFFTAPQRTEAETDVYKIDPIQSTVIFKVMNRGVSHVYGRFNNVSGRLLFDDRDPSAFRAYVTIKSESLDTNNRKRDHHLKGPDFFNAKQFRTMTSETKESNKIDEDTIELTGDLTVHGKTRSTTIVFEITGAKQIAPGVYRVGGETTFKIKRSDFGMSFGFPGIGDEVTFMVNLEGQRK